MIEATSVCNETYRLETVILSPGFEKYRQLYGF
jgi:hypothetical protein